MDIRILESDLKDFPKSLQLLHSNYGISADCVKTLFAHFAGEKIYIPQSESRESKLSRTIGSAFSHELIKRFGGNILELPLGKSLGKKWRNEEIKEEIRQGVPPKITIRKFRINRETYRQIKKTALEG